MTLKQYITRENEYFATRAISNSSLSNLYQGKEPFKTYFRGNSEKIESRAMEMGSAVHAIMMFPELAVVADIDKPTQALATVVDYLIENKLNINVIKDCRTACDAYDYLKTYTDPVMHKKVLSAKDYYNFKKERKNNPDLIYLTAKEKLTIDTGIANICREGIAPTLQAGWVSEQPIYTSYTYDGHTIPIKIKPDMYRIIKDTLYLLDYKSTTSHMGEDTYLEFKPGSLPTDQIGNMVPPPMKDFVQGGSGLKKLIYTRETIRQAAFYAHFIKQAKAKHVTRTKCSIIGIQLKEPYASHCFYISETLLDTVWNITIEPMLKYIINNGLVESNSEDEKPQLHLHTSTPKDS